MIHRSGRGGRMAGSVGRGLGALILGAGLLAPLTAASAQAEPQPSAAVNPVLAWNRYAGEAAVAACIAPLDNPLHESRMYAMTHLAMHDALNAIDRRSQPYALRTRAPHGTSVAAAVAAAARGVLAAAVKALPDPVPQSCIDAGVASIEAHYAAALRAIPPGAARRNGLALGRAAADAVLAKRSGDGSDTTLVDTAYPQGHAPGEWRFTPDRPFAFAPGWGDVTPFALRSARQYRPEAPYPLRSRAYARDLVEVQRLGGDDLTTPSARSADQTEIALFWLESSPLMWNAIARRVAASRHLDVWESARLFGLLNAALADGYIASFDTKYLYRFWRPVTAIRQADHDGNPATTADRTWTPLVTTPPIPDHDSAHAVEGGAAAAVLASFFGTDDVSFRACSVTLPQGSSCDGSAPVFRRFPGFAAAARENAVSRIYIGFHFRHASQAGLRHGARIGTWTIAHLLRPDETAG